MFDATSPTPLDLRFRLFGIPVRVHPVFWLLALLLGPHQPRLGIIWIAAVFISVLVHEFGHALPAKAFGAWPSILLFGFGGLTFYDLERSSPGRRIFILICGPLAGFLLAAVIVVVLLATGQTQPEWPYLPDDWSELPREFVFDMLFINIAWGILNLFPVYPLDGGQITRTIAGWFWGGTGRLWACRLSFAFAVGVALLALFFYQYFTAALFGMLAFEEFLRLRGRHRDYSDATLRRY